MQQCPKYVTMHQICNIAPICHIPNMQQCADMPQCPKGPFGALGVPGGPRGPRALGPLVCCCAVGHRLRCNVHWSLAVRDSNFGCGWVSGWGGWTPVEVELARAPTHRCPPASVCVCVCLTQIYKAATQLPCLSHRYTRLQHSLSVSHTDICVSRTDL